MSHNASSTHLVYHILDHAVGSTQDVAKDMVLKKEKEDTRCIAIIATQQTKGRGTQGRTWEGLSGNLYLTLAVPLSDIPTRITLLPLFVGATMASHVDRILVDVNNVKVKWPNDVLLGSNKLAGVLMESVIAENNDVWLLVGIGVNVAHAPSLQGSPGKHVRVATCLQDYRDLPHPTTAIALGQDIAESIVNWIYDATTTKEQKEVDVIETWRRFADLYVQSVR